MQQAIAAPLAKALAAAQHDLPLGQPQRLTVDQARLLRLGGWCYHTAAAGSAYKQHLAPDFAQDWMRHETRLAALAPLLQAWDQAGIRWRAFKGLAVVAVAYPHAGMRYAGDVDLVLPPQQAAAAARAVPPPWLVGAAYGHTRDIAFYLLHPALQMMVEVHHALVPNLMLGQRRSQRMTQALLDDAQHTHTVATRAGPVVLRTLQPQDLVMSLVMNRCWSGDAWRNKVHDYLDVHYLAQVHGLDAALLARRARELGMARTWARFALHCNPFAQRLDLLGPRAGRRARLVNDLCMLPEALPPSWRSVLHRLVRAPGVLLRAARAAPTLRGVVQDLAARPAPQAAFGGPVGAPMPVWQAWQVEQAVRWAQRLLGPLGRQADAGPCVVQSLAVYRLLRRMGVPARWNLGHRKAADGTVQGHAWVDCPDPLAFGVGARVLANEYEVGWCYPALPGPAPRTLPPCQPPPPQP